MLTQTILSNGLKILLKEIHTAPIISHWVWYRVGSRDETPGKTGVSHWVEHMQFKGTPRFPSGVLDKAIARCGGYWNAFTYLDWTTYFETLPTAEIDLALELEADRMTSSNFTLEDAESERTVIISERQGHENEPLFRLDEAVQSTAFEVHPYRNEVIGLMVDLQTLQRDDLYEHYRRYYNPSNAILAVAGDFDSQEMLTRIEEIFGGIPGGKQPSRNGMREPTQMDERHLVVSGPGETTYLQVAYHAPAASDPDFFAFTLLDSLLSGPSSLNLFGGGISNKTSRLYRALIESERAVGISGGFSATIDPYLYTITITIHPQSSPEESLSSLSDEIKRIQDIPPSADEVQRALKQARALFAYGSESITNQAYWLGFTEMFADYDWYLKYLNRLANVTPDQIQQAAQKYLQNHQRVRGVYRPNGGEVPA